MWWKNSGRHRRTSRSPASVKCVYSQTLLQTGNVVPLLDAGRQDVTSRIHCVERMKLSKPQLDALLAALGSDREQVGAQYLKLREKLVDFFLWNRSDRPQEDADEAMDRLAKRIAEGEPVVHMASYAQKIARLVLLESNARSRRQASVTQFSVMPAPDRSQEYGDERTFDCLEPCL